MKKDAQKNAKLQERSEEKERKQAEREEKAVQRAKPTKLQQLKPTGAFETDLKPGMSKLEESTELQLLRMATPFLLLAEHWTSMRPGPVSCGSR